MSKTLNNPYLASKQLWHDLYGSVETKLTRANRIILVLCLALAISTLVIGLMATQPRIQPYVAVLHGNEFLILIPDIA